jgi:hypothetical protein
LHPEISWWYGESYTPHFVRPAFGGGTMIDTQLIELAGRNRLIESILAAGLDVALPIRDDGADLIVYRRKGERIFSARPVQLKTATSSPW